MLNIVIMMCLVLAISTNVKSYYDIAIKAGCLALAMGLTVMQELRKLAKKGHWP